MLERCVALLLEGAGPALDRFVDANLGAIAALLQRARAAT